MDFELAAILIVTRRLTRRRGTTRIGRRVARWYLRKPRERVVVDVLGSRMDLDPSETVDGELLFFPHLYDSKEILYLSNHLQAGDCFLDLGAHIGFYSLMASRAVGPRGRVLAVEADPSNYEILSRNIALSGVDNIDAVNVGLSDRSETLRLGISTTGVGGARKLNTFGGEK